MGASVHRAERRVKVAGAHALGRALIGTGKGMSRAVGKGQRATGINPESMHEAFGRSGRKSRKKLPGT